MPNGTLGIGGDGDGAGMTLTNVVGSSSISSTSTPSEAEAEEAEAKSDAHASTTSASAAVWGVTVVTTSTLAAVATDDTSPMVSDRPRATEASKAPRSNASMLVATVVEKRSVG